MQLSIGNWKFNARPTALLGALAFTSVFSKALTHPGGIVTESVTLDVPNLPPAFDGLTITHISDFHADQWLNGDKLMNAMRRVNALDSDIVMITGDFTTTIPDDIAHDLTTSLHSIRAREGVYAVLGNHDYWRDVDRIVDAVQASGVNLLRNAHTTITREGQTLYIAGVDDIYEGHHDLDAALAGVPAEACTLLLAHEPDFANTVAKDGRVAVQFSGHSHGGQFRLPIIGIPWLPPMGREYVEGAYDVDGMKVYVTRGLGVTKISARINCPPEITHITLRRRPS